MRLFVQQFSFWPCLSSPGEGTRPTPPTIPPSCRPGALTRRPYLLHNENCCQERTAACGCARAVAILVAKIKVKAHPFAVVGTLGWRHPHLVQPPLKVSPYFWRNRLHGNALGSHRPQPAHARFPRFDLVDRNTVHARCALVGAHPPPGLFQRVPPIDPVIQHIKQSVCCLVRLPMQLLS